MNALRQQFIDIAETTIKQMELARDTLDAVSYDLRVGLEKFHQGDDRPIGAVIEGISDEFAAAVDALCVDIARQAQVDAVEAVTPSQDEIIKELLGRLPEGTQVYVVAA